MQCLQDQGAAAQDFFFSLEQVGGSVHMAEPRNSLLNDACDLTPVHGYKPQQMILQALAPAPPA